MNIYFFPNVGLRKKEKEKEEEKRKKRIDLGVGSCFFT